jgi:hypothetical protein
MAAAWLPASTELPWRNQEQRPAPPRFFVQLNHTTAQIVTQVRRVPSNGPRAPHRASFGELKRRGEKSLMLAHGQRVFEQYVTLLLDATPQRRQRLAIGRELQGPRRKIDSGTGASLRMGRSGVFVSCVCRLK